MRLILLRAAVALAVLLIIWLAGGRHISTFLDRFHTSFYEAMPVRPFVYESGAFWIAAHPLSFAGPDYRSADAHIQESGARVTLTTGGKAFPLGSAGTVDKEAILPRIEVIPDPGDEVTLTTRRSMLGWPTPFEMNFMTGHSPSKKWNFYYILHWKKTSGASLEMVWRYEQWLYRSLGLSNAMTRESVTGLVRIVLDVGDGRFEKIASEYALAKKGWKRAEFRIEQRGSTPDGRGENVAVIYLADERAAHPGGGQSIVLVIDRQGGKVVQETGGQ